MKFWTLHMTELILSDDAPNFLLLSLLRLKWLFQKRARRRLISLKKYVKFSTESAGTLAFLFKMMNIMSSCLSLNLSFIFCWSWSVKSSKDHLYYISVFFECVANSIVSFTKFFKNILFIMIGCSMRRKTAPPLPGCGASNPPQIRLTNHKLIFRIGMVRVGIFRTTMSGFTIWPFLDMEILANVLQSSNLDHAIALPRFSVKPRS